MYQRDGSVVMEVVHAPGDLNGPVDEHGRLHLAAVEHPVEGAAPRELHHEAQIGLVEAHADQLHDVVVVEEPEPLGLLEHAVLGRVGVLAGVEPRRLDGDFAAPPVAVVDFAEAPDADDFLQFELFEVEPRGVAVAGDVAG